MSIYDNSTAPNGLGGTVQPGGFNQTPSASSSTEIAPRSGSSSTLDEVDVFYNSALNPLGSNSPECVAGFTGFDS